MEGGAGGRVGREQLGATKVSGHTNVISEFLLKKAKLSAEVAAAAPTASFPSA